MRRKRRPAADRADPAGRTRTDSDRQRRLRFEKTIAAISERFVSGTHIDEAINRSLADIGALSGASRACVIRFPDEDTADGTHEWCAEGVPSVLQRRRNVPCAHYTWAMGRLRRGQAVVIEDVSALPEEADRERTVLEARSVRSLLAFPLHAWGRLAGAIGFENTDRPGAWPPEDVELLRIASRMIGTALVCWESQEETKRLNRQLRQEVAERTARLQRSERQHRALVENLNVGVFRTTPEGRCLRANAAAAAMFGYDSVEEFLAVPVVRHYADPADRERYLADACDRGSIRNVELPQRRKDGTLFWVSVSTTVQRDESGRVRWLDGIIEDITQRKHAEDELRRLSQFNQGIIDAANVWLNVLDDDLNVLVWNRTAERISGYRREEVLGDREVWQWLFPDEAYRREVLATASDVARNGRVVENYETTVRTRQGQQRVISWHARNLTGEGGQRLGSVTIGLDVTEQKRTERALRQSELRYRLLAENVSDLIWTADMDLAFTYVSPTVGWLLGYTEQEAVGMSIRQVLSDEGFAAAAAVVAEELAREAAGPVDLKRSRTLELEHVRKDGSTFWGEVKAAFLRDEAGRPIGIEGVSRDISEREAAEQALRQSEARYRGLVESQQDFMVLLDPEGRFTFINDAYCRALGKSRQELLGQPYAPLVHEQDVERTYRLREEIETSTKHHVIEVRILAAQGILWVEWEVCAVRDESGKLVEMQCVGRDVTQRREAEQALRRANRALMTAREEERRHLAAELHDSVGQSLVALKFSVQNAAPGDDDPACHKLASALAGISSQCSDLIREVRHICQGLYPPTLESLGLSAALSQMAGYYQAGDIQVDLSCGPNVRAARFPHEVEIALFRIAQEALNNAVRHGHARHVAVTLRRSGGEIQLAVEDNGVGFDPADTSRYGLGLNTMRQRAGTVGGELTIDSRAGRTRVRVRAPVA